MADQAATLYAWAHDWILQPHLLPAWLSGFAAIVALFISVWSARRADAATRRRDLLQSRGIAVAILPELQGLLFTTQAVRDGLTALVATHGELVGQSVAASVQAIAPIQMPSMIDRNIDRLFMLGDLAGPACLQLVAMIEQHNELVEVVAQRMMLMRQWPEAVGHLREGLALIDSIVPKCVREIRPLQDAIKG